MEFSLEKIFSDRHQDPGCFSRNCHTSWQEVHHRATVASEYLYHDTPGLTGLLAGNGPSFVQLLMGALQAWVPLVLFSPRSTSADLQRQCSALGVTRIFVADDLQRSVESLDPGIEILQLQDDGSPIQIQSASGGPTQAGQNILRSITHTGTGSPPALLQFTSGSTGKPRVAVRSRASLAAEIDACRDAFDYRPDDVIWSPAPFFHAYGLVDGLLCGMAAGASFRFAAQPFTHQGYAALESMDATVVVATPPFWRGLLAHDVERKLLPCLRRGLTAGAPLDLELAAMFRARFGFPMTNIYGMTELGTVLVSRPDDPPGMECQGFLLPGYQARLFPVHGMDELGISKPVDDLEFLTGQDRKLHVRDGFYLTGDCALLDPDGRVHLQGRISDFINVGGEKVAPADVVAPLADQEEIIEAVAFGIPSSWFGQTVGLYVQTPPDSSITHQKLHRLLTGELPTHMQPTKIMISKRPVPRTPTGKILRGVLLDWLEEERDEGRATRDPE